MSGPARPGDRRPRPLPRPSAGGTMRTEAAGKVWCREMVVPRPFVARPARCDGTAGP